VAIGLVQQKGSSVYVYDEKGRQLCVKSMGRSDSIIGYTSQTFTIKKGNSIYIYDEKGRQTSVKSA